MREKKLSYLVSILVLCFCINANSNDYKLLDRIIVSIEKDVITQSELDKELANVVKNFEQSNLSQPELKKISKEVLDRLIENKLMEQYAEKIGIKISAEEINLVINNILKNNNVTLEELQNELSQNGGDINEFKHDLILKLTIQKIKDREIMPYVNVSKYEVESFLKKEKNNNDTQYKLFHILIKHDNPEKDLIKLKISKVKNTEEFKAIALQYSDGPFAEKYGDLGWNKKTDLPNIFTDFLNQAKINDMSEAIESSNGLHFLKVEDISSNDKNNKVLIRQYKYQQILIKNNLISSDDDLKEKLNYVKNLINTGMDFSEAIKKYSDDQFSYDHEKLNWVNFDDLLPEFRANLSVYPKQDLIGPFKTELGWHLIKVYGFREEDFTNEAEQQRAKIQIAREKTELRFKDWLDALLKNSNIKYFDIN